jgi:hypothetical protein
MIVYVYVSDATETTIITSVDHGKTWEVANEEVYDLIASTDVNVNIIHMDGRPSSAHICTEKDLEEKFLG